MSRSETQESNNPDKDILLEILEYRGSLFAFAYGLAMRWTIAERCVQETLVAVASDSDICEPEMTTYAWMQKVIRRKVTKLTEPREGRYWDNFSRIHEQIQTLLEKVIDEEFSEEIRRRTRCLKSSVALLNSVEMKRLMDCYCPPEESRDEEEEKKNASYYQTLANLHRHLREFLEQALDSIADYSAHESLLDKYFEKRLNGDEFIELNLFLQLSNAKNLFASYLADRVAFAIAARGFELIDETTLKDGSPWRDSNDVANGDIHDVDSFDDDDFWGDDDFALPHKKGKSTTLGNQEVLIQLEKLLQRNWNVWAIALVACVTTCLAYVWKQQNQRSSSPLPLHQSSDQPGVELVAGDFAIIYGNENKNRFPLLIQSLNLSELYGEDLKLWLRFEGDGLDESINPILNGRVNNVSFASGKWTNALYLKDRTASVVIPHSNKLELERGTIEFWIYRTDSYTADEIVLRKKTDVSQNGDFHFTLHDSGQLSFTIEHESMQFTVKTIDQLTFKKWHHIVLFFEPKELTLFLNTVLQDRQLGPGDIRSNKASILFGNPENTKPYFRGGIDEFSMYSKHLSREEIYKHFETGADRGNFAN